MSVNFLKKISIFFPISKPVMAVHHMAAHALMPRLEHE